MTAPNCRELARAFHEAYERLAPNFGYETREASRVPWDEVPEANRALMTGVVHLVVCPVVEAADELAKAVEDYRLVQASISFCSHGPVTNLDTLNRLAAESYYTAVRLDEKRAAYLRIREGEG